MEIYDIDQHSFQLVFSLVLSLRDLEWINLHHKPNHY